MDIINSDLIPKAQNDIKTARIYLLSQYNDEETLFPLK